MARRSTVLALGMALVALSLLCGACSSTRTEAPQTQQAAEQPPPAPGKAQPVEAAPVADLDISGPFQHGNLSLFLIHGEDTIQGGNFLTLDEALEQKVLVVHETDNVSELSVDNLSNKESIFIQGGEIVSGGKQDRMLGIDIVLRPGARKVKIASFCVEQGRWSQRGGESVARFASRSNVATSKEIKLAARLYMRQGDVWSNIGKLQRAQMGNVTGMALNAASPTSLDLTLEDPKLKAAVKAYTDKLAKALEGKDNVVGFAFAINGELNSADLYGSNALFKKLWPKLLKASAAEAIAKLQKDKTFEAPAVAAVKTWLEEPRKGKAVTRATSQRINARFRALTVETAADVLFDTVDESRPAAAPVHRSYVKK